MDRTTPYLLPPSVEDWLPKRRLARFVVDIVDQLDLSELIRRWRGGGSAANRPSVTPGLLIYCCATEVYSSRRIETATHESIAFRDFAANEQPDHDSLCAFRKRFLKEVDALFVLVLRIAREMKLLKPGTIALDGTKIHANDPCHSALSHGHARKIEARLEAEVKEMLARAEAADQEPLPEGLSIRVALRRRESRLAAIRQAKAQIGARAAGRDAQEKADCDAKVKAREDRAAQTGKKPGGVAAGARREIANARHLAAGLAKGVERRRRCGCKHCAERVAPIHSIASSARGSGSCGIAMRSAVSALPLITNSKRVGCSTGRSADSAPFKMRSTQSASRW